MKFNNIITFNNIEIRMIGDNDNPLFYANDILVKLLGHAKIRDNNYYK